MTREVRSATWASHPGFSDRVMSLSCDTGGHARLHVCGATSCHKAILPGITTSSSFGVNLGTAVVERASYFLLEDHFVKFLYVVRTSKHSEQRKLVETLNQFHDRRFVFSVALKLRVNPRETSKPWSMLTFIQVCDCCLFSWSGRGDRIHSRWTLRSDSGRPCA